MPQVTITFESEFHANVLAKLADNGYLSEFLNQQIHKLNETAEKVEESPTVFYDTMEDVFHHSIIINSQQQ